MALVKKVEVDKTEIIGEFKMVQVRTATWVEENGAMIGGKTFSRAVIAPGDDVSSHTSDTQAVVAAAHTSAIVTAYNLFVAEQASIRNGD
tara:strand:- start:7177 stop:7446 length:270 start_codon:yes stop_codon:yes gene_type:complete